MDEQLFPPRPDPQHAAPSHAAPMPSLGPQLANIATRLKLIEERYANLQRRNALTEESLLAFEKDSRTELKILTKQTTELRKHLAEVNTKVDAMLGELGQVVQKHEFAAVERYLDLWQPMQFLTREEAKRMIDDAIRQRQDNA